MTVVDQSPTEADSNIDNVVCGGSESGIASGNQHLEEARRTEGRIWVCLIKVAIAVMKHYEQTLWRGMVLFGLNIPSLSPQREVKARTQNRQKPGGRN